MIRELFKWLFSPNSDRVQPIIPEPTKVRDIPKTRAAERKKPHVPAPEPHRGRYDDDDGLMTGVVVGMAASSYNDQ